VRATEIRSPRDHDTRVGDRLLKREEMGAWIAARIMRQGRQWLAIGLGDILSRDSATGSRQRALVAADDTCMAEFEVPVGTRFRTGCRIRSKVYPFRKPEASGKLCGVTED